MTAPSKIKKMVANVRSFGRFQHFGNSREPVLLSEHVIFRSNFVGAGRSLEFPPRRQEIRCTQDGGPE